MSNLKKNTKKNKETRRAFRLYIIFEEGKWMQPGAVKLILDYLKKDYDLEDFGTGNAYNDPWYLLDVIEGHEDNAMVVAWDWDEDKEQIHPRFLVEPSEICPLIEALKADSEGDSWEIAVRVNKEIRSREE